MNLIQSNVQTMSSREIAELTGKEHSNVKRDISAMVLQMNYPDLKLKDCPAFDPSELKGHNIAIGTFEHCGNTYDEFHLDHDYTILLVSGYSVTTRMKIIKRWQELEQSQQPKLPTTYIEALESLVQSEKEKAKALEQLEEQAPVIEYHNKVLAAPNGITTTEIASELGVSAIHLNKSLQAMKVQRKVGGRWVLTAANLDQGYTVEVTHVDDGGKSRHSMKWTEKGRKFIHELMTP